ncbi:MAG: glutamate synthase subunit alpha, partial [Acidimicrobiia bacterium]|nr:glutamate synthase subunit alpha [Acidimicrobiia bacterium]
MVSIPSFYDPSQHHDACGVGFISDRSGRSSHRLLKIAVNCLHGLDHRGAKSADGTGDGAGLMTRIPYRLIEHDLSGRGITPPPRDSLGVVMVFLPTRETDSSRKLLHSALEAEGLAVAAWRRVPVGATSLSDTARAGMPIIEQVIVDGSGVGDVDELDRRLLLARKAAERNAIAANAIGFSVPSASAQTVVYKGLFTASTIEQFYWDLADPMFETDFAIFHQRYSTNTFPSWSLAQPFRVLAHN